MQSRKENVTPQTECLKVTSAQKELLNLLNHQEVKGYFLSLKKVHYLGTYCIQSDMVELSASSYVHNLMDAIQKIHSEHFI